MGVLTTASLLALGVLIAHCFKIEYVQVPEYQGGKSVTLRPVIKTDDDSGHSANVAAGQPQPKIMHDRMDIAPQKYDMDYLSKTLDEILSNYNAKIAGSADDFYKPKAFAPIYQVEHVHDLDEDQTNWGNNFNFFKFGDSKSKRINTMEMRSYDEEETSGYKSPIKKKLKGEVHYHQHDHYHNHEHNQDHIHEHKQEHKHAHKERNKHDHQHQQKHAHEHHGDHSHSHNHKGDHLHEHNEKHDHGHKHVQQHLHKHLEEHKHGHDHEHGEHHKHDHGHQHSHYQDHKHDHGHDHKHDHHHGHSHDEHHEHKHGEHHGHKHDAHHDHKHGHLHDHKHGHKHIYSKH